MLGCSQSPLDVTTASQRMVKNVVGLQKSDQELRVSYKPTAFRRWVVDFEDFPSSDVGCDVIKDLCRPLILEDGHVECKTVTFQFRDARVSGYLKSVEITEKLEGLFVHFEFIPV